MPEPGRRRLCVDNPTGDDLLGFGPVVESVVAAVSPSDLDPVTVALQSSWGGGKSSALKLIETRTASASPAPRRAGRWRGPLGAPTVPSRQGTRCCSPWPGPTARSGSTATRETGRRTCPVCSATRAWFFDRVVTISGMHDADVRSPFGYRTGTSWEQAQARLAAAQRWWVSRRSTTRWRASR